MSFTDMLKLVGSLFVVLVYTSSVAQGRVLQFEGRETRDEAIKGTLAAANDILETIPVNQLEEVEQAVRACVESKNDHLIKKLALKTMSILHELNQKIGQDAQTNQVKARSYDIDEDSSDEEFEGRGAMQDLQSILDNGKIFLDKLSTHKIKKYEKLYKEFGKASSESKQHYFELVIKYANKCATGVDFSKY